MVVEIVSDTEMGVVRVTFRVNDLRRSPYAAVVAEVEAHDVDTERYMMNSSNQHLVGNNMNNVNSVHIRVTNPDGIASSIPINNMRLDDAVDAYDWSRASKRGVVSGVGGMGTPYVDRSRGTAAYGSVYVG